MANYRAEFPDFPADDMPAIPEGFEDTSWHNDVCPSFTSDAAGFTIWIDYADKAKREWVGKYPRFRVDPQKAGVEMSGESIETDSWDEVLEFIAAQKLAKAMAAAGYSILDDHREPRQSLYHVMQRGQIVKTAYSRDEAEQYIEENT